MGLHLVPPPPPPPRPPTDDEPSAELRAAGRAMGLALTVATDKHLRRMIEAPLSIARHFGCDDLEVNGLRLVEDQPPSSLEVAERLLETLPLAIAAPDFDDNYAARSCFELLHRELVRRFERWGEEQGKAEARTYVERFRSSDLPDKAELMHNAKRALVAAGYWKLSMIAGKPRSEVGATRNVGPKAMAQLDAILAHNGMQGMV